MPLYPRVLQRRFEASVGSSLLNPTIVGPSLNSQREVTVEPRLLEGVRIASGDLISREQMKRSVALRQSRGIILKNQSLYMDFA